MSCYCIQFKNATESMLLQELAFANGYTWPISKTKYQDYGPWLFFDSVDKMISWSATHYKYDVLAIEDMISFIKDNYTKKPICNYTSNNYLISVVPNCSVSIDGKNLTKEDVELIIKMYRG